jgi:hypothetical protein
MGVWGKARDTKKMIAGLLIRLVKFLAVSRAPRTIIYRVIIESPRKVKDFNDDKISTTTKRSAHAEKHPDDA